MHAAEFPAVWITGVGVMTPAGHGSPSLRNLMRDGRSALRADPSFDGIQLGRVDCIPASHAERHLDRAGRLFVSAAEEAWQDAGLVDGEHRVTVIEGSSLGPMPNLVETLGSRMNGRGVAPAHPLDLVRFMPGAGGAAFAQRHALTESSYLVSAGSISGALAIAQASERIACGLADVVIAGGAEAPIQRMVVEAFLLGGVQVAYGDMCLPFDERHSGTALADGAGVFVLESAQHALARGARARARILGFGSAAERYNRVAPDPDGEAVVAAARQALGSRPPTIDWIKAHGTGTRTGDEAELRGLSCLFGPALQDIPLTSLKSAIGHSLGASGAVEAVATVLALEEGLVPGTCGFARADRCAPACSISAHPRPARAGAVLLLSQSFGGRAAALLVGRGSRARTPNDA